MKKPQNASQWGSAKARERYPCGGMVKTKLATGGPALGGGRGPFGGRTEEEFIKNSERAKRQKLTEPMGGYAGDAAGRASWQLDDEGSYPNEPIAKKLRD